MRAPINGPAHRPTRVRFAGYAALFDRADRSGDVIRAGAFAQSLARGRPVPLLREHDPDSVIGEIEHLAEDRQGLRVTAHVDGAAAQALVTGERTGLSFGYRVQAARGQVPVRELITLDLIEVSLVRWPMQPLARVHATLNASTGGTGFAALDNPFQHPSEQGDTHGL